MKKLVVAASLVACLSSFSSAARAHIEMTFPTPRFDDTQNKWCPCGTGGDGSRSNNGCAISKSDPNPGSTRTAFTAGQTITLQWNEIVDHVGRFRVSFDPDGADQPDFDAHVLAEIPDPSGTAGAHTLDVTLPDINCDNCTLQLIQVMNGDVNDPVATPVNSYFQCANLSLSGAVGEGEGSAAGEGEGAAAGEGEGEGAPAAATPSCASTTTSRGFPFASCALLSIALVACARKRHGSAACVLLVALTSSSAQAHIALTDPPNRYGSNGVDGLNKQCPCGSSAAGASAGDQYCSNGVTSDPNRSSHVTTYAPGSTVTVTWIETVAHSGRMRIAFDDDGADLADFNKNILVDIADPAGSTGKTCTVKSSATDVDCSDSSDNTWKATFTLPNTECGNCTLQVIQDMSGDTTDPVADPSGDRTYFQCADLVLDPHAPAHPSAQQGGCASTSTSAASFGALALVALVVRRRRDTSVR